MQELFCVVCHCVPYAGTVGMNRAYVPVGCLLYTSGSTVTQQLAKNMYFSQEKELVRKVAEVLVAFDLERNYSKNEILELYVNCLLYTSRCV